MDANAKPTYAAVQDLPPKVAEALLDFGLVLADTKHQIGMQTSHWVTGTPALEAAVGASAITQDELGHARALFSLITRLPGAPESLKEEDDLEARPERNYPAALAPRWESWLDMVAVNVTLDRALHLVIVTMGGSSFEPLKGIANKMDQEEKYHRIFGDTWVRRLSEDKGELAQRLSAKIEQFGTVTTEWFNAVSAETASALSEAGVLTQSLQATHEAWQAELAALLNETPLESVQA